MFQHIWKELEDATIQEPRLLHDLRQLVVHEGAAILRNRRYLTSSSSGSSSDNNSNSNSSSSSNSNSNGNTSSSSIKTGHFT